MSSNNGGKGSFPGFDFMDRVGQAMSSASLAQARIANEAWSQMRSGNLGLGALMQFWARSVEAQYGTVVELSRGPGFVRQPAWIYFDYTKGATGQTALEGTATLSRSEALATTLDQTDFAYFEEGPSKLTKDDYTAQWLDSSDRTHIKVTINKDAVERDAVEAGQYVAFVLAKGRTSEPPLLIVMVRISAPEAAPKAAPAAKSRRRAQ
jgi:hypothetical protein